MEDRNEKEMQRNQVIAIVLMTVLVLVWFQWFMPKPAKQPPATPLPASATSEQAESPGATKSAPAESETVAGMPPVPEIADPAAEEVVLADDDLEVVFTRIGARLKQASVLLGDNDKVHFVPMDVVPDTEALYPLGLRFTEKGIGDELDRRRFDAEVEPSGKAVTFTIEIAGKARIRKRFALGERPRVLDVRIDYENLDAEPVMLGMDQTPAYFLNWAPDIVTPDGNKRGFKQTLVWRENGQIQEMPTGKLTPAKDPVTPTKSMPAPEWVAVKSVYFLVALKPEFEQAQGWAMGSPGRFRFGLTAPRFTVEPGATQSNAFSAYLGPMERSALAQGWPTLSSAQRFFSYGWLDAFAKFLLGVLNWFYKYIPNYGIGIVFLTILARLAVHPLTLKSMKSMKKMQKLAPEIEEIKAKCGDDQQEMSRKMMELYKERGVNPMGGCLPMMLQMPFFIALYRMLWSTYELRGAPFVFWITDLSEPDRLFHMPWLHAVPFVGTTFEYLNVLPILMGLAMFLNQKMTPAATAMQNPQQKMMMNLMPAIFCLMCYNLASGLSLYILTSTLIGMALQKLTSVGDVDLKPKKTIGKGQHFYTAAQARKRQMAREAKRERRVKKRPGGAPPK